jgi:hypothetical protein
VFPTRQILFPSVRSLGQQPAHILLYSISSRTVVYSKEKSRSLNCRSGTLQFFQFVLISCFQVRLKRNHITNFSARTNFSALLLWHINLSRGWDLTAWTSHLLHETSNPTHALRHIGKYFACEFSDLCGGVNDIHVLRNLMMRLIPGKRMLINSEITG